MKRPDLLHTEALAKYNLLYLKISLILGMCYDLQETNKKKEKPPNFKKIC